MITLIDNYDSFTYNLVHYIGVSNAETKVYRNDEISAADVIAEKPRGIVISPGPAAPDQAGICLELIMLAAEHNIPLLGVCLGHQSIAQAFGGTIIQGTEPVHGKVHEINHTNESVFKGLPETYNVTRYHSLIVERESLPDCFNITAKTHDDIIMGISHTSKPIHGVQFHPESIATEHGHALIRNFLELT